MAKAKKTSAVGNHSLSLPTPVHRSVLLALFFVVLILSFKKGLFSGEQASFEAPIYIWGICISLIFPIAVWGIFRNKSFYKDRLSIVHLLVFLSPVAYALALITAASSHYSLFGLFIQIGYACCFLISITVSTSSRGARSLINLILGISYLVIIFGLANWFGDASFGGIFNWSEQPGYISKIYNDAVLNQGQDARLSSIFQYPNTYAALLLGVLFINLIIITFSRQLLKFGLLSIPIVPIMISFILTGSRGAFIMLPILFILVLLLIKPLHQIVLSIYLAIASVISILLSSFIFNKGIALQIDFNGTQAFLGWTVLIVSSMVYAGLCILVQRYVHGLLKINCQKWENRKLAFLYIPISVLALGIILVGLLFSNIGLRELLPNNIQEKIAQINFNQNSVLTRGTFFEDALSLWKDYPITGAGGGAWKALYEVYQSTPYTSREAHSFYLQVLVESGLIGVTSLFVIVVCALYHFIRSYRRKAEEDQVPYLGFFILVTALLLHSAIDFNMSFIIIGTILYLGLGGLIAGNELPPFKFQEKLKIKNYFYPLTLLVGSIGFFILSVLYYTGSQQYATAKENALSGKPLNEIVSPLDQAISKQKHPEYLDLKLQLYLQLYSQTGNTQYKSDFLELVETGQKLEPMYKFFSTRKFQLLMLDKNYDEAISLMENSLLLRPWDITAFEALASAYYQSGLANLNAPEDALIKWNEGLNIESRIQSQAKELENLPDAQVQGRTFGITPDLALTIGQIHFYLGHYAQAEEYLKLRIDTQFNDNNDYEAALFYLATLAKQSKSDSDLYDSLLNAQTVEQSQITERLDDLMAQEAIR